MGRRQGGWTAPAGMCVFCFLLLFEKCKGEKMPDVREPKTSLTASVVIS